MRPYDKRKLIKIAKEFSAGVLDGKPSADMCFAVSYVLGGYLKFMGYVVDMQQAFIDCSDAEIEHWYLILPDGLILDCTADQFNEKLNKKMPMVYIGKKPSWYRLPEEQN